MTSFQPVRSDALRRHGHRRGRPRGGLATMATIGGLGYAGRRSGMGGKLGLAALGYMAYRAYQDHQGRQPAASGDGSARASGGLGDMIRGVAERLTGGGSGRSDDGSAASPDTGEEARAADRISDETALLLIRAMVTAAWSDGALTQDERRRILEDLDRAGVDSEERRIMEREIGDPRPLDELLPQVRDAETAQEFYLASRAAIEPDSEPHRAYLTDLRRRLGLSDADAAEIDEMMG